MAIELVDIVQVGLFCHMSKYLVIPMRTSYFTEAQTCLYKNYGVNNKHYHDYMLVMLSLCSYSILINVTVFNYVLHEFVHLIIQLAFTTFAARTVGVTVTLVHLSGSESLNWKVFTSSALAT